MIIPENRIELGVVVGSRAYGLSRPDSDWDRRGFYIAPTKDFWTFRDKPPEQYEDRESDSVYFEAQKFMKLALGANPKVLEILWSPLVEVEKKWAKVLRENRDMFLSKKVVNSYGGYARAQQKRFSFQIDDLEPAERLQPPDPKTCKHAMHTIRLLHSVFMVLEENRVLVDVSEDKDLHDLLVTVRDGKMDYMSIFGYVDELELEFKKKLETSSLPDEPDYTKASNILKDIRLDYL